MSTMEKIVTFGPRDGIFPPNKRKSTPPKKYGFRWWTSDVPDLADYVRVYGNVHGLLKFLSVQFIKPVLYYDSLYNFTSKTRIPPGCIVVVPDTFPVTPQDLQRSLVFYKAQNTYGTPTFSSAHNPSRYIRARNKSHESLLLNFFPHDSVRYTAMSGTVFYVIAKHNPFEHCWEEIPRGKAFDALVKFTWTSWSPFNFKLEELSQLTLFRSGDEPEFDHWEKLCHVVCRKKCASMIGDSQDLSILGQWCKNILKRTDEAPEDTGVPSEFYACEVTLDDSTPLGINYKTTVDREVLYVSPMVSVKCPEKFKDVNGHTCDRWIPLYHNKDRWLDFGLEYYTTFLGAYCTLLERVMGWLEFQTADKYVSMLKDLKYVHHILCPPQNGPTWGRTWHAAAEM